MIKHISIIARCLVLTALLMGTRSLSAKTESIRLPFSFCGRTAWEAEKTDFVLHEGEKALTVYQLKGFTSNNKEIRSGSVYYLPDDQQGMGDLIFKDVQIRHTMYPALVDVNSQLSMAIHFRGKTVIENEGSIIRSNGSVMLMGVDNEEELDDTRLLEMRTTGKEGRPVITLLGDLTIHNLKLDVCNVYGSYGFINTAEREAALSLFHTEGKVVALKAGVAGFSSKIIGRLYDIEGIGSDKPVPTELELAGVTVYSLAEVNKGPEFEGGDFMAFAQWANEHIEYPAIAQEQGIQGRVTVQFTVDTDGHLRDIKILRGVDGGSLDKAAFNVIESSPAWKPAVKDGEPVACRITLPINFRLK